MKLNKLLEKQLRKFLPAHLREEEGLQQFIQAVNDSYHAYERDSELSDRAFRMSEEEYREINRQLKQEIDVKQTSIGRLREMVAEIPGSFLTEHSGEGELLHIASYLKQQISLQKEAEQKLQDQKHFYEQILNHLPADLSITDEDHRYLFVNPSAIKNPEVRAWIIGKTDEEYAAFRNRPAAATAERRRHFDEAIRIGKKIEWEEKIVKPDGSIEYHLRILHPVFDEQGHMDIMIIYGVNITERKEIEEKVKLSELRYRSIFDNSQALICTHNLDGTVLDVNNASLQTLGYSREELSGSPLSVILPEEKRAAFESEYLTEMRQKGKAEGIMTALSKDGKKVYLLYQNYLVNDPVEDAYVIGFSQNITTRIEAQQALKKNEEKYQRIIANMNLGLIEIDEQSNIVYANHSFCEMCGYDPDELIGKHGPSLFLKGDSYDVASEVAARRKRGESNAYEMKVKNKRGELKWWLISGAPVFDESGKFKGSIGIHFDITLQKELEEELRKAKSDAEHSAHIKELFLANMSHEIRTPMNAVLGITRLLAKTQVSPEQEFYLSTIQHAANNLLVIINDLLDFSKVEAGKISLEHIGFNLASIVENVMQVLQYKAEEKGLLLSARMAAGIAPVLMGDPYRINQVLINLISNAIKFTESGSVKISCSVASATGHTQEIRFRVEDTGIGISEDFLHHLFDKFTQEDESVTRKFGGTGLGMSISKQLIEFMGGEISAESIKNKGTTVFFTITFAKGSEKDLPDTRSTAVDTQVLKDKRILVVEDNEINRLVAYTVLAQYGATVYEAGDGNEAIQQFEKGILFDLVLMDIQMPGKDGLETTRHIRSHIDTSIPIIALTANAFKQEEERCLEAGMNDFIAKPFDVDKLVQLVARWLGKIQEPLPQGHTGNSNQALFDLDKLYTISRGDNGFIKKMLELFIEEVPRNLRQMEEYLLNGERKLLASLAHRIKPSVQSLHVATLTTDLQLLEQNETEQRDMKQVSSSFHHVKSVLETVVQQLKELLKDM